ncbi:MAG: sensor histidine kinase [Saprospiraceae bacterium]
MKKQKISYFLMAGCLFLLAGFLAYWLHSAYQKEQTQVETELTRIVIDSKREIQDSLLQLVLTRIKPFDTINDRTDIDTFQFDFPTRRIITQQTTLDSFSTSDEMAGGKIKQLFDQVKRMDLGEVATDISIIMTDDYGGSEQHSFSKVSPKNQQVNQQMVQRILENLRAAPLPQNFVCRSLDSLNIATMDFVLPLFKTTDQATQVLQFRQFPLYIIQEIIPQILFSIFLFSLTGLAFYLVHQNLQEQKKLMALKNNFISNMTHELKTPIATIGVAIEAIQDFGALQNPERTKEYLNFSKTELNRLSLLVEKVLNIASFEDGSYALNREPTALVPLVQKVLDSMQLQLNKLNAKVHFEYDQADTSLVFGDPVHLSNILNNLLDNSLKYSTAPAKISIKIIQKGKSILLHFKDEGIGIPAAFQSRIFERFFRVPTGDVHAVKGHGLGLSYVAEIIRQHEGEINLTSEENVGTQFDISIPKYEEKL